MPNISYQLYCSRNFPPLADTLSMLSEAGYKDVEGFGGLFGDLDALRAGMDATGITMPTSHVGLDMLENEPDRAIEIAQMLGVKAMFVPHIGPDLRATDPAGWVAFGTRLAEAGKPLRDAGLTFGWHNHDFEFDAVGDGEMPLDLLLSASDDLALELDLGWVQRAGQDPVVWINRYADRLAAVHVKDIAPAGEAADEDGWADVGHGTMDWAAIHAALGAAGCNRYVIEHDNPSDDARFATRSINSIKGW